MINLLIIHNKLRLTSWQYNSVINCYFLFTMFINKIFSLRMFCFKSFVSFLARKYEPVYQLEPMIGQDGIPVGMELLYYKLSKINSKALIQVAQCSNQGINCTILVTYCLFFGCLSKVKIRFLYFYRLPNSPTLP